MKARPVNNTDEHHSGNPAAGGQTDADRGSIGGAYMAGYIGGDCMAINVKPGSIYGDCMAINVMPVCFRVPSAASICGDYMAINVLSFCYKPPSAATSLRSRLYQYVAGYIGGDCMAGYIGGDCMAINVKPGSICGDCMAINVMPVCFRVPSAASICGDYMAINVLSFCYKPPSAATSLRSRLYQYVATLDFGVG
ncbi:hypothetical protein MAR_016779 [Mya arenaria]|uniref:Uncharacterized protein n=1 Tax=Mya arenaria TaxID=6604 RepID=A0ABY7EI22_MYAAR|nr:hypothetical protein MAR_016779 [Mya arenaria]